MLFNSIDFAIFLPIVFALYWLLNRKGLWVQNLFILLASYVFYGWWDWRFLFLIFFSTVVDFTIGRKLAVVEEKRQRKRLLAISLVVNLGLLGFFKYFNFFVDSFASAFTLFGVHLQTPALQIILPVGISFYTFQTLSYTIDIYRRKLEPTQSFVAFAAFVSFFPQLVAGPIERASNLLPQFLQKRSFHEAEARDGLRQILWGLFKKMVIADGCALYVDAIFNHAGSYTGSTLLLGAILFSFQIYGDFSGYSDIAIGSAKLFNFKLMQNFAYPYFSRDIAEFWRRWHISLSTWFRDYLYIPLGGSRGNAWQKVRNTFAIFVVSGFWHGANWTFIVWGALNALYFLPLMLFNKHRKHLDIVAADTWLPSFKELIAMIITFGLTVLAWVFFRADSVGQALIIFRRIFSPSILTRPSIRGMSHLEVILALILFMLVLEWLGRKEPYGIAKIAANQPRVIRWLFYAFIIFLIGMFMQTTESPFIYFQF